MSLSNPVFQQVGGRCKIVEEDAVVPCTMEQVARSKATRAAKQERTEQKLRAQQSNVQKAKIQVKEFLQSHKFPFRSFDVNAAKRSTFGLCCTYPLHLAAKERDWHMVRLLLYFGANPLQRDSHGQTVFDYMEKVPEQIRETLGRPGSPQGSEKNLIAL